MSAAPPKPEEPTALVRVVVDPRRVTAQEIADALNAIRAEARRRARLVNDG